MFSVTGICRLAFPGWDGTVDSFHRNLSKPLLTSVVIVLSSFIQIVSMMLLIVSITVGESTFLVLVASSS